MEDIWIFVICGGIVLLLIWIFKWLPNGNKNKMNKFVGLLNNLNKTFTMEMVINYLPYSPTYRSENTLEYNISRLTSAGFDGHYASSETSSIHFELIFKNNYLSELYRILPNGQKILIKEFF